MAMIIVGLVLAGLAALVHGYIFVLESIAWTSERTRRMFGVASIEDARTTRLLAFNQGFYNLFLAVIAIAGIVLVAVGETAVGAALVFAATGSMAAAAIVLSTAGGRYRGAALRQGLIPLLAIVALAVGLAL